MKNSYFSLIKIGWHYARRERVRYILTYTLFACASATYALFPVLYGRFVDAIQRDGFEQIRVAWLYAGAYMLVKIVHWAFHGPARILESKIAFNLSRNFLVELYHQAVHLPFKWHQDNHSGATINRIRKAFEAIRDFFQNAYVYVYSLAKFSFSLVAMILYSPLFGTIGVVLGVIVVWINFKLDRPYIKALHEANEKEHFISSTLFDSLSNIVTVISLRLEKRMETAVVTRISDIFHIYIRGVLINEKKWLAVDMLVGLIYVVTVLGYVYQNWRPGDPFMIGSLVALLGFVTQFTSVFQDIAWQYTKLIQLNADVQATNFISNAYNSRPVLQEVVVLAPNWKRISIERLNFSHCENVSITERTSTLHDISIVIERGKRIALIGDSGSGKSTLMALLRGLHSPAPGLSINVDGSIISINSIANATTLFPQEPEIFESTISHNITLGLPFEEIEILNVCRLVRFDDIVAQLPNGFLSCIKEKGVNLSGGQKQRLALARGILAAKASEIILMDEPTSSIDFKTEKQIFKNLFEEYKDKAVITSLHRLHLLDHFDYIYMIRDGRIVEQGTFAQLKSNSSIFRETWEQQALKIVNQG